MTTPETGASGTRELIAVQGLGFVGAAMATAIAIARDEGGDPAFDVVGVELDSPLGRERVEAMNAGRFPFPTTDDELVEATARAAKEQQNLTASTDPSVYERADVVVVNVNLDIDRDAETPTIAMDAFRRAIGTIAERLKPGGMVLVETTVPPGTCEHVVAPLLTEGMRRRGLPEDAFLLAHSYERVMPGREYLRSITNFWRCYAGHTEAAAQRCGAFLSQIINVGEYPLTRLSSTVASETAKVLENSYRATTIAFMEEWGRFAEEIGFDLFEVIDAIRLRPTHSNIRQPGFGVGGYCLTKDPLFAEAAAREIYGRPDLRFPYSTRAVETNLAMPLVSLRRIEEHLGDLSGRTLLLLGLSYRQDVGDTRHSPSEVLVREARARGATVLLHDPLVRYWDELDEAVPEDLPDPGTVDAVVLAVAHEPYRELDVTAWLADARPLVFDANAVLSAAQRIALEEAGHRVRGIGRGGTQ